MLEKDRRWLVYQGSVFAQHQRIPNEHYVMTEEEWEARAKEGITGNAVVLQRGLTFEVANKMVNLTRES